MNVFTTVARPLGLGIVTGIALVLLSLVLGPLAQRVLAWVLVILSPASAFMAWRYLGAQRRHPEDELLAVHAEIAVLVTYTVLLIAGVAANFLLGGPRGYGFIPLATAMILLTLRPAWFLVGALRGRW